MSVLFHADDYGKSSSVNHAIITAFEKKYISRTSIMVNMPFCEEALQMSLKYDIFSNIGLHLNLTEGLPLTDEMRKNSLFCNDEGCFSGAFRRNKLNRIYLNTYDKECCIKEITAQMNLYVKCGFPLMHIDSHNHIHNDLSLLTVIVGLAKENGFKSMRICRNLMSSHWGIKQCYKILMNKFISRYFDSTKYFGSYSDYNLYGFYYDDVEVMLHPDVMNSRLVDIIGGAEKYVDFELLKRINL